MMARTQRSTPRMYLASTLLFGALMVLALVAFPQQSAHAAPKPKTVNCQGPADAMACDRKINEGDTVKVKQTYGGKAACTYTYKASTVVHATKDGSFLGFAKGLVTKVRGTLCPELSIKKGENTEFDYTLKAPKGGGKQ